MSSRIPLLTTIVAICFLGLMAVQAIWINKVIEANKTLFRSKVETVLKEAANTFRTESSNKENLSYAINTNEVKTINSVKRELHQHIKTSFKKEDLDLNFQYAVYAHQDDNNENRLDYKFGDARFSKKLPICSKSFDPESQSYQVPLTCSIIPDNPYHLAVLLPTQNSYLFSTLMNSLVASIIFTLALISLFIYFLYMVYRQKKLAQIKDDFINNLTHEFKTPIFSIGLAAGLLKRNEAVNSQQHLNKYLTLIETEKTRLENGVNKILQMAMIDSGNFVLDKKAIDINNLIESVVQDFTLALEGKGGNVELKLSATNTVITGDEMHLKNVIFNILDNALKYTKGPPVISITTVLQQNNKIDDFIIISINDNGIGMSEEIQRNVFSKFYRGHSGDVHDVKGFGLGMSYVKSIVEAHGGSIRVESIPGKGSTFHVTLPVN